MGAVAGNVASTALINTDVIKHLLDLAEDEMSCQVQKQP